MSQLFGEHGLDLEFRMKSYRTDRQMNGRTDRGARSVIRPLYRPIGGTTCDDELGLY